MRLLQAERLGNRFLLTAPLKLPGTFSRPTLEGGGKNRRIGIPALQSRRTHAQGAFHQQLSTTSTNQYHPNFSFNVSQLWGQVTVTRRSADSAALTVYAMQISPCLFPEALFWPFGLECLGRLPWRLFRPFPRAWFLSLIPIFRPSGAPHSLSFHRMNGPGFHLPPLLHRDHA